MSVRPPKWIVVGAGSAGCVVARRLVDAGSEVVLVEAGPPLQRGAVPAAISGPDSFAALDEPGRIYPGLVARRTRSAQRVQYLRGRGVGGSSAVNSMVALRGDDRLYSSWGWDDLAGMFQRVEVPSERPQRHEIGRVTRTLLEASSGAEVVPLTRRDGRRVTAAEAYLWPVSDRVTIVTATTVDRVVIDGGGVAVGVRLVDGTVIDGDAVAVCAGAIHTPAILLRSGIVGPGVGTGLQDHPAVGFTLRWADPGSVDGLTTAGVLDLDPVQILPIDHLGAGSDPRLAVLLVALMRPVGADGVVRLATDDPRTDPEVDLDLLGNGSDVERLTDGAEAALEILETPPFTQRVDAVYIDDVGTPASALADRAAIEEWIRDRGADYVHASSSMSGALDDHGRVSGHDQLFVADASAFPSIPNVNTHMPTMMLAERFVQNWINSVAAVRT